MNSRDEISFREIISGILIMLLSYFIIAFLNMSNEDIYNWDLSEIFSKGGWFNIVALILLFLWLFMIAIWILSLIIRIIRRLN